MLLQFVRLIKQFRCLLLSMFVFFFFFFFSVSLFAAKFGFYSALPFFSFSVRILPWCIHRTCVDLLLIKMYRIIMRVRIFSRMQLHCSQCNDEKKRNAKDTSCVGFQQRIEIRSWEWAMNIWYTSSCQRLNCDDGHWHTATVANRQNSEILMFYLLPHSAIATIIWTWSILLAFLQLTENGNRDKKNNGFHRMNKTKNKNPSVQMNYNVTCLYFTFHFLLNTHFFCGCVCRFQEELSRNII